jgi:hypothetical protein
MKRLFGLAIALIYAPACVLAVNVHGNKVRGDDGADQGADTDPMGEVEHTDEAAETDLAGETSAPAIHATATLDPAEITAGTVEIIRLVATADVADATLQGISFDDRALILDTRALDDGSWMLSVHAVPDAVGPVDLHLDYGTLGVATVPDALHILPAASEGEPGAPGDPADPTPPCE